MDGLYFIYKSYFRVDQFTRNENMLQIFHYAQRYLKDIPKETAVDWIQTAPLLADVIRSRREPGIRVTMAPKTYDCRGILQIYNRRCLATFLRHDRGFSPMMFAMNMERVKQALTSRVLQVVYYIQRAEEFEKFRTKLDEFIKNNKKWIDARIDKTSMKPFIFPMHFSPYSPFKIEHARYRPRQLFNNSDYNGYQNILSELNQLPPGILVDYNICRVLQDTTVEISRFAPRRLLSKNVPTKEKFCETNEFCYKVISDNLYADEYLGALKIRRSVYGGEPPATVPFVYLGDNDDVKCKAVAYSMCQSESLESLASMSGWSTDSFASTATLTPGDSTFNWQGLSKEQCSTYKSSDSAHNPRLWAHVARKQFAARIAFETDERLLLAKGDDGRKLCVNSKNVFFKDLLAKDQKIHRARTAEQIEEHQTILDTLRLKVKSAHILMNDPETSDSEKMRRKEILWAINGLLEMACRRANCFYPDATEDRYRGLDISPSWMAALDARLFSDEQIESLSQLISSRDSWNMKSPLTDPSRSFRCDELVPKPSEPVLPAVHLMALIGIGILLSLFIISQGVAIKLSH